MLQVRQRYGQPENILQDSVSQIIANCYNLHNGLRNSEYMNNWTA